MKSDEQVEFGTRIEGQRYRARPGSYAIIVRNTDQIAVIRTDNGVFLPGGGAEPGETPEETLRREVLEETGRGVKILRPLGFAIEYLFAKGEGYFAKRCSFFLANLLPAQGDKSENDHHLEWVPISTAIDCLEHDSQKWAISRSR